MKTLVVYYSKKGSNKFLATKISEQLECDIEELKPRSNVFLFFLLNINFGIRSIKSNISDYDRIILCGPIFVGRFIPPLKSFVKKYKKQIKQLIFVTCCGSTFEKKEEKFGHALVFKQVKEIMNDRLAHCEAFPIDLVVPESKKDDEAAFMETHLDDSNFHGEIQERFDKFIKLIQ
ncbi:MAG: hypothetical protein KQH79_09755 [Bacteroidetes bacterium]|nr:hypothetical protein [Bacteroidota bacterium]